LRQADPAVTWQDVEPRVFSIGWLRVESSVESIGCGLHPVAALSVAIPSPVHDIPFEFLDYDLADETTQDKIMRELDAEGVKGFPFVRIGDQTVEGYQPERFAKLLGIRSSTE
jgi:hypothetical protein